MCIGKDGQTWVGHLQLLLQYMNKYNVGGSCVYMRWLEEASASSALQQAVRMIQLRWARTGSGRGSARHYDVVQTAGS